MIIPVVLAGGSGTRLWPLSRKLYPKQFMPLVNDTTLLQSTLTRLDSIQDKALPIVMCNEDHRFIVAEQLHQINQPPQAIVLEPVGRNTAPALTVAALIAMEREQDPMMLVLPADHYIPDARGFAATVEKGSGFAGEGYLVTFGIEPLSPETGYGYIRKGKELTNPDSSGDAGLPPAWIVDQFVEKPNLETAQSYLESRQYCWNSGMFLFQVSKLLQELEQHAPEILEACRKAVSLGKSDLDFFRLDKEAFSRCPSDSIDYAVMEKTKDCVMVSLASEWSDLGSWEALWQAGTKDGEGNVVHGDVCLQDVRNSFVHTTGRLVTAVGLIDHVVVETKDAVFVAPRTHVQQVKSLVDQLKDRERPETVTHRDVYRPWGYYEDVDVAERFLIKRITVKPKGKLSLQKHLHRAEHWVVVRGTALVTKGDEEIILKEDESIYIPLGTVHRLENPGQMPLELVEVQTGTLLGEEDVIRLDDVYGRHNHDQK